MINFWVLCALLTLLACLFLIIPLIRIIKANAVSGPEQENQISRESENVAIFKLRLAELEIEKSENDLSESLYQQRREDLETSLLNDVRKEDLGKDAHVNEATLKSSAKPVFTYSVILCSVIFVIGFSFYLYQTNGSKALVDEYERLSFNSEELQKAKDLAQQGNMSALLNQLHEKLKLAPENLEGWQLLARSSMNVQRYDLAAESYLHIIKIYESQSANAAPIYGLLAQAQYYQSEGKLNSQVKYNIDKAFSLDENELNSLGLLAIDAFSNGRLLEAKQNWLQILSIYPDHPARPSIEAGIQRVNAELGLTDETIASSNPEQVIKPSIEVKVSIDPEVLNRVSASDTVFILAKQVTGSVSNKNIPLAVSRHRVDELPITVKLDDSKSMAPIAKLSMAESVMVVARISKSGNPIAQSGDFEAVSSDITLANKEIVELLIQSEVP